MIPPLQSTQDSAREPAQELLRESVQMPAPQPAPAKSSGGRIATQTKLWTALRAHASIIALVGLAGALRVWILTRPGLGDDFDLGLFVGWMRSLNSGGFAEFYGSGLFGDYPPLMMILYRAFGWIAAAVTQDPSVHALRVAIKSMSAIFELAIGILLYVETRHIFKARRVHLQTGASHDVVRTAATTAALVAASLFLFNPAAIYESAYWGQVDAVPTAFMLGSLMLVRRRHWIAVGFVAGLGLTAKFQTIVLVPLLLLEATRMAGVRGLARLALGTVVGLGLAAVPFVLTGTLDDIVSRAYINVVGQYPRLSNNAYNLWYVVANPGMPNGAPPHALVAAAAKGASTVSLGDSFLLTLSLRKLSVGLFGLVVGVVLSLYSRRPGSIERHLAAGLLVLAFFLFPTEMHERYAYPALALLAPWAATRGLNERAYWVISTILLLNLAAVLPIHPLAPQLSGINLALFAGLLASLVVSRTRGAVTGVESGPNVSAPNEGEFGEVERTRSTGARESDHTATDHTATDHAASEDSRAEDSPSPWVQFLLRCLRWGTAAAVVLSVLAASWFYVSGASHNIATPPDHLAWLSELEPEAAEQGWGELRERASVTGEPLRIGSAFYLEGIGTHAPARLVYSIPEDAQWFEAVFGIDASGQGDGSARVRIDVDGRTVFRSTEVTAETGPRTIKAMVTGGETLTIHVDPTADGNQSDHVDLALARFAR